MTHWLDTAIFYEIYSQSFKDSDADGIGDFRGIVSRLDYIQSLGCNAIWMNPCFESPFNDAGYDVSNYFRAAPRYGTNEDLKALFCAVHDRGMRILLDLVPGHTSIAHPWFQASMRPEPNSFSDRYIWTNDVFDGMTAAADAQLCGWLRGISDRSGAAAVNFFSSQPALNYGYANPQAPWQQAVDAPGPRGTIEAMKDVMRFWLDLGCDGFRVDMALSLVKGDPDRTATIRLWREFRAMLDVEVVIGEAAFRKQMEGLELVEDFTDGEQRLAKGERLSAAHLRLITSGDPRPILVRNRDNLEKMVGSMWLAEDVVVDGEVLASADTPVTRETAERLVSCNVREVRVWQHQNIEHIAVVDMFRNALMNDDAIWGKTLLKAVDREGNPAPNVSQFVDARTVQGLALGEIAAIETREGIALRSKLFAKFLSARIYGKVLLDMTLPDGAAGDAPAPGQEITQPVLDAILDREPT